jgi:hypothetical protein
MEDAKAIFTIVSTIIALLVFGKGVLEFVRANAIRRYEKFHEMSIRFDENADIQKICTLLHGARRSIRPPTKQEREVFICFLEEIYFMMKSGIMKRDLALYTSEAVERLHLPFPLLSDVQLEFARALQLPTFIFAGLELIKRLTLIARTGRIEEVLYPVFPSDADAERVVEWLTSHGTGRAEARC